VGLVAVVDLLVIVGWVFLADRLWPGEPPAVVVVVKRACWAKGR
jgi:hypothetical protein